MADRSATDPATSTGRDTRVPWVDYAKGICICLVVMMHSTLGVGEAAGGTGFMHHIVEFARPFRMPDFFLISGLFLSLVINRGWRLYLDRKVVHFAYFYLLWLLIQGVFKWPVLAVEDGAGAVLHEFLLALVQPYGTLWFIYVLPIFFVAAKLLKPVPPYIVLGVAAALETARIQTGWDVLDESAMRFFYFAAGWYFAPFVFDLARIAAERSTLALAALAVWVAVEIAAVRLGVASLPGLSLVFGLLGCAAVVSTAALLARFRVARIIRYAGEHSIAVYLSFFLPMAATRVFLVKTGIVPDIGWMSLIVTLVAIGSSLTLYWLVERTGRGRFLFERPAAFRLSSAPPKLQPAE